MLTSQLVRRTFGILPTARLHPQLPFKLRPRIAWPSASRNFSTQTRFRRQYQYSRFQQTSNILQRWYARPTFRYEAGGIVLAGAGFYTYNLEEVPVSHRKRFNLITPEQEASISKQQFDLVIQQYQGQVLPDSDKRVRRVRNVLDRLIPSSGLTGLKWEIHVIESDEVNAFVIPGYVIRQCPRPGHFCLVDVLSMRRAELIVAEERCLFLQESSQYVRMMTEWPLCSAMRLPTL
jgi:hypothetical protein